MTSATPVTSRNSTIQTFFANSKVVEITDNNFDKTVLGSTLPVLLFLYADWCGPCMALMPIIAEFAETYDGKVQIAAIDVDKNPQVPINYGIRAIPTQLFFKDGETVDQLTGAHSRQKTIDKLEEIGITV